MLTVGTRGRCGGSPSAHVCVFAAMVAALAACLSSEAGAEVLSAKRGFADTGAYYGNLQAVNAGWYYRWGPTRPSGVGDFDAQFLPMFWNGGQATASNINTIKNYGDVEWVLGFNEPERTDQANMTVAQAISAWQTIDNGFAGSGIKLVSPAVSDTGGGQSWLSSFMSQANSQGLQVDAVAFHWYGVSSPTDPIGAANSFISRVDSYHSSYGLPVWITEFGIIDWGGSYSTEEMRAANATFLENVVPRLESRSYVEGYAFYNWTGDTKLIEGSPLLPTNVGVPYVGTIESGDVYDFSGDDLGDHVAYLGGGELTYSGGLPGTVHHINALRGVSTISGTADWAMNGTADWVRVQPGTTLRKSGPNQVTWNAIGIANEGFIDVAQGVLRMENNPAATGSGVLRVKTDGTLSLHGLRGDTTAVINYSVELQGGTISTDMVNGVVAVGSPTVSGAGIVASHLTASSGTVVRVGGTGFSAPSQLVIDDFEGYGVGDVRDVASPPWTAHQNTSFADIESDGGNNVLTYGWSSTYRGLSGDLPDDGVCEDDQVATFFFRLNSKTDDPDHSFGLGDQATTDAVVFGDFETQVRVNDDPSASGTFMLDARDGGAFTGPLATGLALNSWYNVWMVVDQAADTYDVYLNTGTDDATTADKLNDAPLAFRNGTLDTLGKVLALAGSGPVDNGVRFDDLVYLHGVDLTNPLGGLDPVAILTPETLTIQGDLTLDVGSILELDIANPAAADLLAVSGTLNAGGTLDVSLDSSAAVPSLGDAFDILDFGSASGAFDILHLPDLPSGLTWNTNSLLTTGVLEVVADGLTGDYNEDSVVDAADYTVWCDKLGDDGLTLPNRDPANSGVVGENDYNSWRSHFGESLQAESTALSAVPEPTTVLLAAVATMGLAAFRRRS